MEFPPRSLELDHLDCIRARGRRDVASSRRPAGVAEATPTRGFHCCSDSAISPGDAASTARVAPIAIVPPAAGGQESKATADRRGPGVCGALGGGNDLWWR